MLLDEGIHDPSIFKALFMAGQPGAGKSTAARMMGAGSMGLRTVSSDAAFAMELKRAGMSTDLEKNDQDKQSSIRARSKVLAFRQEELYLHGRLGLLIDATGQNPQNVSAEKAALEDLGYECALVFIDTTLENALANNRSRHDTKGERALAKQTVVDIYANVVKAKEKLKGLFGSRYYEITNTNNDLGEFRRKAEAISGKIEAWLKKKPTNSRAQAWMKQFESTHTDEALAILSESSYNKLNDLLYGRKDYSSVNGTLKSKRGRENKTYSDFRSWFDTVAKKHHGAVGYHDNDVWEYKDKYGSEVIASWDKHTKTGWINEVSNSDETDLSEKANFLVRDDSGRVLSKWNTFSLAKDNAPVGAKVFGKPSALGKIPVKAPAPVVGSSHQAITHFTLPKGKWTITKDIGLVTKSGEKLNARRGDKVFSNALGVYINMQSPPADFSGKDSDPQYGLLVARNKENMTALVRNTIGESIDESFIFGKSLHAGQMKRMKKSGAWEQFKHYISIETGGDEQELKITGFVENPDGWVITATANGHVIKVTSKDRKLSHTDTKINEGSTFAGMVGMDRGLFSRKDGKIVAKGSWAAMKKQQSKLGADKYGIAVLTGVNRRSNVDPGVETNTFHNI